MAYGLLLGFLFLASTLSGQVSAKECTNTPTQLSSHTVRAQLMSTKNETWKEEMLSHYHLNPTDESTWMDLRPRKLLNTKAPLEEFDWLMLYRSMKGLGGVYAWQKGGDFLSQVSLHDVRLDPDSMYAQAQQTNLEYLLLLDVDRLVWNYRNQAGLSAPGKPYGGWEGPDVQLRGHFVGHYMSASAMMWASTHNDTLYERMSAVVDALDACQKKMGTGYLSAFPPSFFDLFEAIKNVWAPYYTIHKIMAGLLDQYSWAGNSKALQMVVWMAEYFGNRVKNVILKYSIERHWLSLNEETGGMNDVLYRLYSITNDQKHLILAHLFDKPCFLGFLALQTDSLSGFHANTHIPVVIGAQMRYEVTGDALYKEIGTFFMDIVNSSHSYATGGTSVSEFWSDPKRLADTLSTENEESCTTYNMLKVSRNLFRWTKEMMYADYYERALMNGVLSIQRGREPGVMIYMLPQGPGKSKARSYHGWGTKFDSFWCCYGTGIESFSKLGDSIYFEEKGSTPGLYIIQYIPSSFNWKSGEIALHQKIKPVSSQDPYLQVTLTISANESISQSSTLNLRIPSWTSLDGARAALNGQDMQLPYPGNFFGVTRIWASNDNLGLQLPINLRTEAVKDDRPGYGSIQAILFGPYLLAGLTDGDWDIKTGNSTSLSDWITAVPASYTSQLTSLTQQFNNKTMVISNSNGSLAMENWPDDGTDGAVHATFRIVTPNSKSSRVSARKMVVGSSVMLEPFDLPGMVVQQGPNNGLIISGATGSRSLFRLVPGLDGNPNTVSLESVSQQGCFVSSGASTSTRSIQLICQGVSVSDDISFRQAASFTPVSGLRQYHPVSFVAKGARRNFLLEPLLNLRDETYTIYFNITA
ncbi:uncharacterized protein LOC103702309 isoform X2 [Phoenix dactylifera]|nr:uncharacterized protein LOC103702309 isoform X2 [Phoenix dactylifera]XP_017697123.1 uncharacterized protein LOC103702309 isoform X2 [Phoenix dactylifera]XP_017697124.1 uncharacterized protein LOC103702309 isoform X2 [Phoenix dactylifera]XP_017697125.1 uncharacterized protein LOC103702309 isoform X2 [Phoenix dactylifera]